MEVTYLTGGEDSAAGDVQRGVVGQEAGGVDAAVALEAQPQKVVRRQHRRRQLVTAVAADQRRVGVVSVAHLGNTKR